MISIISSSLLIFLTKRLAGDPLLAGYPHVQFVPVGTFSGDKPVEPEWITPGVTPGQVSPLPTPTSALLPKTSSAEDTSPCLPLLGLPPIPLHLVRAIREQRFIDLEDLLPEALQESQFDSSSMSKDTKTKETEKKKKYSISSTLDWSIAFAIFSAGVTHADPSRAFSLATYASIVLGLARNSKSQAWLKYDRLFRQAVAVNLAFPWHRREQDLWLMALSDASLVLPPLTWGPLPFLPPAQRGHTQRGTLRSVGGGTRVDAHWHTVASGISALCARALVQPATALYLPQLESKPPAPRPQAAARVYTTAYPGDCQGQTQLYTNTFILYTYSSAY